MSKWKEQLRGIYNELSLQEILHETLRDIDKSIISGEKISNIINQCYLSILKITKAKHIEFLIGTSVINISQENIDKDALYKERITVDACQDNWDTFIDYVDIYLNKDSITNDICMSPIDDTKEAVETIARQINIAISSSIEKKVNKLHHEITRKFAQHGDADVIFDLICRRIVDIIPTTTIRKINTDDIKVQLLLFPNFGGTDILKIVGSTSEKDIGGFVDKNHSTSGSLFYLQDEEKLPNGYKTVTHNNIRYVYFMGNPKDNKKFYKKTSVLEYKSELTVPIYSSKGKPIGVINMEAVSENSFKEIHAKTLIYHASGIAELASSISKLKSTSKDAVSSLLYTVESYVSHAMAEFEHQIGHPKQKLSSLIMDIKSLDTDTVYLEKKVNDIFNDIEGTQNVLRHALDSFNIKQDKVSLERKVDEVKVLISEHLTSENIKLNVKIDSSVNYVKLDNLFSLYLYSLLQNSIDAIIRKKLYLLTKEEKKRYQPEIKITARPQNEYSLELDTESERKKCHISIYNNGIGIENEKIPSLGKKGVTYRGGTGTGQGLYSLRQYLSLHGAKIVDIQSDYGQSFSIHFVVELG